MLSLLSLRFGQISPLAFFMIFTRPRIGMLSLVTVSPVIIAFHSCCQTHHVFDQVNLWPIWNRYLLTMLTWNRRYSPPLSAVPRAPKGDQGWIFWSYKSLSGLPESDPYRIFVIVFNWNFLYCFFLWQEETTQKLPRWGQNVRNK